MSPSLWLSRLKRQFQNAQNRKSRLRGYRHRQQSSSAVAALAAPQVVEILEDRTMLTAFTVVNTDDAGAGSLRAAIEAANANAGADTISFDASLTGQTIVLTDELLISDDLTITGLGADQLTLDGDGNSRIFNIDDGIITFDPLLKSNVEISGLTLMNGYANQGGAISSQENFTINDCVIINNSATELLNMGTASSNLGGGICHGLSGYLSINNCVFSGNRAGNGGGLYISGGESTINNSVFSENLAILSTGEGSGGGEGGGIYTDSAIVTTTNCQFHNNTADLWGGGVFGRYGGSLTISRNVFNKNTAEYKGGGVYWDSGSMLITDSSFGSGGVNCNSSDLATIQYSTFVGDPASPASIGIINHQGTMLISNCVISGFLYGGIANGYSGSLTIEQCTISNNSHVGVSNSADITIRNSLITGNYRVRDVVTRSLLYGAGFYNYFGTASIFNCTISGNTVLSVGEGAAYGGGIFNLGSEDRGLVYITNSTITGNTSSQYGGGIYSRFDTVTLVNTIVAGNYASGNSQIDVIISGNNNIVQDSIDGLLDPVLRDNGGATLTHKLLPGSAAIDAGDNTAVIDAELDNDQRGTGFDRIVGGTVDIGAFEVQIYHTQLDLGIVDSKTATNANDEVSSLPQNLDWIDEWSGYWVEIWISTPTTTDRGILSAAFDLSYNTDIATATLIEYGSAFSLNQTGAINDQNGVVENLSARTSLEDVGADQYVLFARICFESTAIDLDLEGQRLSRQRPDFSIENPEVLFFDGTASDEVQGADPPTQILANPFDLNDDGIINFRDLIRFASVYQQTPSQSASDDAWFADYNQDDHVDFHDLILFATNYGKRKAGSAAVTYPGNYPDAWNQLLMVAGAEPPQKPASTVTQAAAETLLEATVEEISPQLTAAQQATLSTVDVQVVDLAEGTLGRAAAGTIYLDVNASGYGWFVDATPTENSEFVSNDDLTLIALPDSEAAGVIDLRTVILHELAHLLGYEHASDGLMQETLAPGVRYLSDWEAAADEFFGSLTDDTELTVI